MRVLAAAEPVEKENAVPSPSSSSLTAPSLTDASLTSFAIWALTAFPAAAASDIPAGSPPAGSYYVSLGLFVLTFPGQSVSSFLCVDVLFVCLFFFRE